MIKLINKEFFQYDVEIIQHEGDGMCYAVINIMGDPSNVTVIDMYRKIPLVTLVIEASDRFHKQFFDMMKQYPAKHHIVESNVEQKWIDDVINLVNQVSIRRINSYSDSQEYQSYVERFSKDCQYDVNLLVANLDLAFTNLGCENNEKNMDNIYAVAAIPLLGIAQKIDRSPNYTLLNGSFVKTPPYRFRDRLYNKLIYVQVEVHTVFQFNEFITDTIELGTCRTHVISGPIILNDMIVDDISQVDIQYHTHDYQLALSGREEYFEKPKGNIFVITNRPYKDRFGGCNSRTVTVKL